MRIAEGMACIMHASCQWPAFSVSAASESSSQLRHDSGCDDEAQPPPPHPHTVRICAGKEHQHQHQQRRKARSSRPEQKEGRHLRAAAAAAVTGHAAHPRAPTRRESTPAAPRIFFLPSERSPTRKKIALWLGAFCPAVVVIGLHK